MTSPGESYCFRFRTLSEGLKDAEAPEQWAIQRKLIEGDFGTSWPGPALEMIDVDRSFDQMRAARPLRQLPLILLSADRSWGPQVRSMIAAGTLPSDVPSDFGYVTDPRRNRRKSGSNRAERETHPQYQQRPRDT